MCFDWYAEVFFSVSLLRLPLLFTLYKGSSIITRSMDQFLIGRLSTHLDPKSLFIPADCFTSSSLATQIYWFSCKASLVLVLGVLSHVVKKLYYMFYHLFGDWSYVLLCTDFSCTLCRCADFFRWVVFTLWVFRSVRLPHCSLLFTLWLNLFDSLVLLPRVARSSV